MDGCCHVDSVVWDNRIAEPQAGQEGRLTGRRLGAVPDAQVHIALVVPAIPPRKVRTCPVCGQGQSQCDRKTEGVYGESGLI